MPVSGSAHHGRLTSMPSPLKMTPWRWAARKAFQEVADHDARQRWLSLPYLGCDGVPKTGQAWVRNTSLAATDVIPLLAGVDMLVTAIRTGAMPPELSQVAPHSFPTLEIVEKSVSAKASSPLPNPTLRPRFDRNLRAGLGRFLTPPPLHGRWTGIPPQRKLHKKWELCCEANESRERACDRY